MGFYAAGSIVSKRFKSPPLFNIILCIMCRRRGNRKEHTESIFDFDEGKDYLKGTGDECDYENVGRLNLLMLQQC